jgi:hypothetical protein
MCWSRRNPLTHDPAVGCVWSRDFERDGASPIERFHESSRRRLLQRRSDSWALARLPWSK